jgi:UDP-glucose 4-epimerase
MRAVVTGGAGFIGSNLVDALIQEGADVLVVDNLSSGSSTNLGHALRHSADLVELDIGNSDRLEEVLRAFAPDTLFHLAAQIDVRVSMDRPAWDAAINVVGSVNVFSAAAAAGVRRVVNTSTGGAIYGETDTVPTPETAPARPLSAYGLSKRTAEEYGEWFSRTRGLDVVTLRYGNVYGPRQDPAGDAGVIALFCDRVLTGRRPIVFGDGCQTRDYVFVGDIVAANIAAAITGRLEHRHYNVGSGIEVSVLELVSAVAAAAGVPQDGFLPEFCAARAGEVVRSCLDVSRVRTEFDLPFTPLESGLRATLSWVLSRTVP